MDSSSEESVVLLLQSFEEGSLLIKAIADPVRQQILAVLSNGEMCACDILQNLTISQSTLSHHMKALTAAGWVVSRKKATWMYYSVNEGSVEKTHQYLLNLTSKKHDADRLIYKDTDCCEPEDDDGCRTTENCLE